MFSVDEFTFRELFNMYLAYIFFEHHQSHVPIIRSKTILHDNVEHVPAETVNTPNETLKTRLRISIEPGQRWLHTIQLRKATSLDETKTSRRAFNMGPIVCPTDSVHTERNLNEVCEQCQHQAKLTMYHTHNTDSELEPPLNSLGTLGQLMLPNVSESNELQQAQSNGVFLRLTQEREREVLSSSTGTSSEFLRIRSEILCVYPGYFLWCDQPLLSDVSLMKLLKFWKSWFAEIMGLPSTVYYLCSQPVARYTNYSDT